MKQEGCIPTATRSSAPKQYAPVSFGEPFNPKSVDGHHCQLAERRARAKETRELADLAAMQKQTRNARPLWQKLWDKLRGR